MLALLPLAAAESEWCTSGASRTDVNTGETASGHYYVIVNDCDLIYSRCVTTFVYEESNGMPGLQRQDFMSDGVTWCQEHGYDIQPDTLVYENPDNPLCRRVSLFPRGTPSVPIVTPSADAIAVRSSLQ